MREHILINRQFKDLNPLICGEEACKPQKSFGPAIRKYTLIHYVRQGKGVLHKGGREYPVHAGEIFIILPDEVTTYIADRDDPWVYQWIGFDGILSEKFSSLPPVIAVSADHWFELDKIFDNSSMLEYSLAGHLFVLLSELLAGGKQRNHYVRQVRDYIKTSYMREIYVEQIAGNLNLDRRYLSRVFKEKTGQTIQEYLISVRMEEARKLLAEGHGVAETALLCGYPDACNFSKMFKRIYGMSPVQWKNQS